MKTIKDLKASKEIKVNRTYRVNENYTYYIELIKKRMQPMYFKAENDIIIRSVKVVDNELLIETSCKKFIYYVINENEAENFIKNKDKKDFSITYNSKINRYELEVNNFEYIAKFDISKLQQDKQHGSLIFRSKDYVFKANNENVYGSKILSENLIKDSNNRIVALQFDDMYSNTIVYEFLNESETTK